jgi:hypothetical protein
MARDQWYVLTPSSGPLYFVLSDISDPTSDESSEETSGNSSHATPVAGAVGAQASQLTRDEDAADGPHPSEGCCPAVLVNTTRKGTRCAPTGKC